MIGWVLLVASAVLLVVGAELFVENAAGAARRLGVTVLAVGILLAGAEPEELLTAVIASVRDRPGLAVGDALGANVTMLTACLGLAALVRPLTVGRRVRQYTVMAAAAAALALVALLDGQVGRVEGGLLVAAYVAMVAVVWWREREPPALGEVAELSEGDEDEGDGRSPPVALLMALVGLTILALATTAELFALVFAALRHDVPEIAVAGVVGSAAYNATATLGAAALARPLSTDGVLLPAALGVVLPLALLLVTRGGRLGRTAGAVLAASYLAYVVAVLA